MNFLNEFLLLLKARYPIIYISTTEEERIEYLIKYCAKKKLPEHITRGILLMDTKEIQTMWGLHHKIP